MTRRKVFAYIITALVAFVVLTTAYAAWVGHEFGQVEWHVQ